MMFKQIVMTEREWQQLPHNLARELGKLLANDLNVNIDEDWARGIVVLAWERTVGSTRPASDIQRPLTQDEKDGIGV